jgi:hypothetical protein
LKCVLNNALSARASLTIVLKLGFWTLPLPKQISQTTSVCKQNLNNYKLISQIGFFIGDITSTKKKGINRIKAPILHIRKKRRKKKEKKLLRPANHKRNGL